MDKINNLKKLINNIENNKHIKKATRFYDSEEKEFLTKVTAGKSAVKWISTADISKGYHSFFENIVSRIAKPYIGKDLIPFLDHEVYAAKKYRKDNHSTHIQTELSIYLCSKKAEKIEHFTLNPMHYPDEDYESGAITHAEGFLISAKLRPYSRINHETDGEYEWNSITQGLIPDNIKSSIPEKTAHFNEAVEVVLESLIKKMQISKVINRTEKRRAVKYEEDFLIFNVFDPTTSRLANAAIDLRRIIDFAKTDSCIELIKQTEKVLYLKNVYSNLDNSKNRKNEYISEKNISDMILSQLGDNTPKNSLQSYVYYR